MSLLVTFFCTLRGTKVKNQENFLFLLKSVLLFLLNKQILDQPRPNKVFSFKCEQRKVIVSFIYRKSCVLQKYLINQQITVVFAFLQIRGHKEFEIFINSFTTSFSFLVNYAFNIPCILLFL